MKNPPRHSFHLSDALWDLWCIASIIGIWPRYIEPNLIQVSRRSIAIPRLPADLSEFTITQFSDLHFQEKLSSKFLDKLSRKILATRPDLIVFTGDFVCNSQLDAKDQDRLENFLNSLSAPYGCYAVFGNHDYANYVSVNSEGDYDLLEEEKRSMIKRGFTRLFTTRTPTRRVTELAKATSQHAELVALLEKTQFKVLENTSQLISVKGSGLNLCGLGEYTLGKTDPSKAFYNYDPAHPGIILLHNPDGVHLLKGFPGEIVLCGHTHGGQVNLPWMWKKFTLLENPQLKRGLHRCGNKWVYINRGISGQMHFRWFARPEILVLRLVG